MNAHNLEALTASIPNMQRVFFLYTELPWNDCGEDQTAGDKREENMIY